MSAVRPEVLKMLIDCFETISTDIKRSNVKKALKTRARGMPAELLFRGLSYTLVLCTARGNLGVVSLGLRVSSCKELVKAIESIEDDEEAGYSLYGALLLLGLRKHGVIAETTFSEVVKNSIDNPVLDSIAYGLADWIKRLAESYIEES